MQVTMVAMCAGGSMARRRPRVPHSPGGGASVRWRVCFATVSRGESAPVTVRFSTTEATPRTGTGAIVLDARMSCSAPACAAPANGNTSRCRGGACDFSCNNGYSESNGACLADPKCRVLSSGTTAPLSAVWAASASEAWAVGDSNSAIRLRCNGSSWSRVSISSRARRRACVWGSSTSNVWVVGDSGTILHYSR